MTANSEPLISGFVSGSALLSSRPLYVQIKERIVEKILDGTWKPGEALPGEIQLSHLFGVSMGTVRRAMEDLVAQRAVVRHRGRGTFVPSHAHHDTSCLFFPFQRRDGGTERPDNLLLEWSAGIANHEEAAQLKLPHDGAVIRIRRQRQLSGKPVMTEYISIPQQRFPGIGEIIETSGAHELYALYQRCYGVTVTGAVECVEGRPPSADIAEEFQVPPETIFLHVSRLAHELNMSPIEYRQTWVLASHYHYKSQLMGHSNGAALS